jgi:hypothetical protein
MLDIVRINPHNILCQRAACANWQRPQRAFWKQPWVWRFFLVGARFHRLWFQPVALTGK